MGINLVLPQSRGPVFPYANIYRLRDCGSRISMSEFTGSGFSGSEVELRSEFSGSEFS